MYNIGEQLTETIIGQPTAERALVLVATFNGDAWLDEQLASVAQQDWPAVDVLVSDDGSTDGTATVLRKWQANWTKGRFEIIAGPRSGFANNFRHLVLNAKSDAGFFAYCDQDDIWLPHKLSIAATAIGDNSLPALFCGRTLVVDKHGSPRRASGAFRAPPHFRNALVQSIAGGNTMVMNRHAFALIQTAMTQTSFVSHDWFTYQMVSGSGGKVLFSSEPQILYRQHDDNLVGSNGGPLALFRRLGMALAGRFSRWSEANVASLRACQALLTPEAVTALDMFEQARSAKFRNRLKCLRRSGVYRQTIAGQALLYMACMMGKI